MSDEVQVDDRVAAAFSHWSARMLANGVPFGDLQAVRAEVRAWDGWCEAWRRRGEAHERLGDDALASGHLRSAGEHWTRAAVCYHFGAFLFFDDPRVARATAASAVRCRTQALSHLDPPGERVEVPFDEGVLAGNLRLPPGTGPCPLVVMVMGLDSTKEEMHHHEEDFLRRGLATFAFDGPGQGEAQGHLAIRHDYEAPLGAVLDLVTRDARVDERRIGLWGVSLGGYYVARAAAFEPRVSACASLSGPFDFGAAWDRLPALTRRAFTVRSHSRDEAEARRRARALSLHAVADRIRCPLLVISGGRDRLFDEAHARTLAAAAAGPVERLHIVDGGHVVNDQPHRYRPASADWLVDRLTEARRPLDDPPA